MEQEKVTSKDPLLELQDSIARLEDLVARLVFINNEVKYVARLK